MSKRLTPLLFLLLLPAFSCYLVAQCPVLLCPGPAQYICDTTTNDPKFWNESYWWDTKIASSDLGDALTDLNLRVVNTCGLPLYVRFKLFLDLDGNIIRETLIDSDSLAAIPAGFVPYNNTPFPDKTEWRRFDGRPVAPSAQFQFALESAVSHDTFIYRIRWNTPDTPNAFQLPQLPYGKHRVQWYVSDTGNVYTCNYNIEVRDCKKPVIDCANGLSLNIPANDILSVQAAELVQLAGDNYTPTDKLEYGIRMAGTSTGFPAGPDGAPYSSVLLNCNILDITPIFPVEVWVRDVAGNADYCESYVSIQDSFHNCDPNLWLCITHCGVPYPDIIGYTLYTSHPALPTGLPFDDPVLEGGCTGYNLPEGLPFQYTHLVIPAKDNDPLNGVSTYDLIRISQHIDGIQLLDTPEKIIAADANQSQSITSYDLLELQKLLLSVYSELPNNTSWRYSPPFDTLKTLSDTFSFKGIKVGDVTCNAAPGPLMPNQHENLPVGDDFCLVIPNAVLHPGDTLLLPVAVGSAAQLLGWQFDLDLGPTLKILDLIPGAGQKSDNYAVFNQANFLSGCWYNSTTVSLAEGDILFHLKVAATEETSTDSAFGIKFNRIWPEAYNAAGQYQPIGVCFKGTIGVQELSGALPVQIRPNPAGDRAWIIPRNSDAPALRWELFDLTGRVVRSDHGVQQAGGNGIEISLQTLPPGIYGYRVWVGTEVVSGELVKQ